MILASYTASALRKYASLGVIECLHVVSHIIKVLLSYSGCLRFLFKTEAPSNYIYPEETSLNPISNIQNEVSSSWNPHT